MNEKFTHSANESKAMHRIPLPYPDRFTIGSLVLSANELIERLTPYLTEARRQRLRQAVAHRTYSIAPVVEGLHDLGNVSAVMRTAEGLGLQPFHVIQQGEKFKKANRVTKGAEKWLDVYSWQHTAEAIEHLKAAGYQVLATHLDTHARPLDTFDFSIPTAIIFGNEHAGLSPEAIELSDATCILPMRGMVQSFNISVAAAIILHQAVIARFGSLQAPGDLTEKEQHILLAEFYLRSIPHHQKIIQELINRA